MKIRVLIGAALIALIVGVLLILLVNSSDVVSKTYPTIQKARGEELVAHGWLPDILPPSSYDIEVSNNLDLNISWGKFRFLPNEYSFFESRSGLYTPEFEKVMKIDKATESKSKGYTIRTFKEESSYWVFQCKPQQRVCEYSMVMSRR